MHCTAVQFVNVSLIYTTMTIVSVLIYEDALFFFINLFHILEKRYLLLVEGQRQC
jgi:hypothetical protein